MNKKCIFVAGARPNFMKIAPILREARNHDWLDTCLVHTGQHYDYEMSESFFKDLGINAPEYHLGCGGGSHAEQTAAIMVAFEKLCLKEKPDFVMVVGDVNSTIAAGLVAKKLCIDLIHVEAGLRSRDRKMPEEINRLATDAITDIFFTTEQNGTMNLINEGQPEDHVFFVGHVMIDNLYYQKNRLQEITPDPQVSGIRKAVGNTYMCMTLHRPSNVDNRENLSALLNELNHLSQTAPIIFPCHPRTLKMIKEFNLEDLFISFTGQEKIKSGIILTQPLGYNDFLFLWKDCSVMLTDSGGLQEETTALGIPCLTLRENTERPITVDQGTNILVGVDTSLLRQETLKILDGECKQGRIPEFWDGRASERIIAHLKDYSGK